MAIVRAAPVAETGLKFLHWVLHPPRKERRDGLSTTLARAFFGLITWTCWGLYPGRSHSDLFAELSFVVKPRIRSLGIAPILATVIDANSHILIKLSRIYL